MGHFDNHLSSIYPKDVSSSEVVHSGSEIFVPVIPLFENQSGKLVSESPPVPSDWLVKIPISKNQEESKVLLPSDDVSKFVAEQQKTLTAAIKNVKKVFSGGKLILPVEGTVVLALRHFQSICQHFGDGVDFVEDMLRKQLIAAIGKELTSNDFDEYMRYHFRKVFKEEYGPKLFAYAIRRPEHYPEGVISIESDGESGTQPIASIVKRMENRGVMKFPINASTKISFGGETFVHTWINHQFSGSTPPELKVYARARQFSNFILMIGNITAADEFAPKEAIIIQNKDDLLIPLLTEVIPTPKAFKKSVESLSKEQKEFATAYRAMQLESTLFGMCVIQIKPQLERVLNLPEDSLTKEIRLTQDLMSLFLDYQIPSDLLSFEGEPNREYSSSERIDYVKKQVSAMRGMIEDIKKKDLAEVQQKQKLQDLEAGIWSSSSSRSFSYTQSESEDEHSICGDYLEEDCDLDMAIAKSACSIDYGDGFGGGAPIVEKSCVQSACFDEFTFEPEPMLAAAPVPKKNLSPAKGKVMKKEKMKDTRSKRKPEKEQEAKETKKVAKKVEKKMEKKEKEQEEKKMEKKEKEQEEKKEEPKEEKKEDKKGDKKEDKKEDEEKEFKMEKEEGSAQVDFTKLPGILNDNFEKLDTDAALHATILKTGETWRRKFQKALLATPTEEELETEQQDKEKNKAFDLLDAISRSGAMKIDSASFHVAVASTHCFDETLINTVIQENCNPIEKIERSALIVSSTIHEQPPEELIKPEHLDRIKKGPSSHLF